MLPVGAVQTAEKATKREPRPAKYQYTDAEAIHKLGLVRVANQCLFVKVLQQVKL
jgi:hypothetical protein